MWGHEVLLKVVPQRFPFLMIDKILSHEFKKSATCQKGVSFSEEVFQGHFPGRPIYPGVLLIEMGLQTTQVMLTNIEKAMSGEVNKEGAQQGFFISVDRFKFYKPVVPGDVLTIKSEFETEAMGMTKANILITKDNEKIALGTVTVG